jgi:hypothetical protein
LGFLWKIVNKLSENPEKSRLKDDGRTSEVEEVNSNTKTRRKMTGKSDEL